MTARLHVLLGAGGVGKTTLAAGYAVALARAGGRVGLLGIDPARRLSGALGLTLADREVVVPAFGRSPRRAPPPGGEPPPLGRRGLPRSRSPRAPRAERLLRRARRPPRRVHGHPRRRADRRVGRARPGPHGPRGRHRAGPQRHRVPPAPAAPHRVPRRPARRVAARPRPRAALRSRGRRATGRGAARARRALARGGHAHAHGARRPARVGRGDAGDDARAAPARAALAARGPGRHSCS